MHEDCCLAEPHEYEICTCWERDADGGNENISYLRQQRGILINGSKYFAVDGSEDGGIQLAISIFKLEKRDGEVGGRKNTGNSDYGGR